MNVYGQQHGIWTYVLYSCQMMYDQAKVVSDMAGAILANIETSSGLQLTPRPFFLYVRYVILNLAFFLEMSRCPFSFQLPGGQKSRKKYWKVETHCSVSQPLFTFRDNKF